MNIKEFVKMVRAMEYLADTEIVREIRSARNYNIKLYQNYCSEEDIKHLADIVKNSKKYIKDGWFKELSNNDIIALGKNYKEAQKSLYTLIYCFYMNDYKRKIGLIEFTAEEENWYRNEANKLKAELVTE